MGGDVDCVCDGIGSLCAPCKVTLAFRLRRDHPDTLSVSILKRRIRGLHGREAALLLEATKRMSFGRNGRYVEGLPE